MRCLVFCVGFGQPKNITRQARHWDGDACVVSMTTKRTLDKIKKSEDLHSLKWILSSYLHSPGTEQPPWSRLQPCLQIAKEREQKEKKRPMFYSEKWIYSTDYRKGIISKGKWVERGLFVWSECNRTWLMFPWAALEVKGGKILEPARTITTTLLKKNKPSHRHEHQ